MEGEAALDRNAEQLARCRVDDLDDARGIQRDDALFEAVQNRRQPAALPLDHRERDGEALAHLVDARCEPPDLVGEAVVHGIVEVAAGDRACRRGEPADASRDEARDGEADDDGERHREQRSEYEAAAQRIARARREPGAGRVGDERDSRAGPCARGQRHDVRRGGIAGRHEATA